ncbi:MAG TPA: SDR family NAD(P)-dependent oxidoreductase, partial [Roseiflexaceae bacterium]|nr:SDR family NAD(P)-dependent oxidoreductase [Roseiflexaceae bacterium]
MLTIIDRDSRRAAEVCHGLRARGTTANAISADLSQAHGIAEVLRRLATQPLVDIFVHSAGISAVGAFATSTLAHQHAVLDVNLGAPLQLTAGVLRMGMLAPGATIVYLASLSVFTGYPGAAVYAASKAGLAAYARSLRVGLRRQGFNVLTVFPGPTRTAHARRYSPDNRYESRRMPPDQLAELVAMAIERRAAILIPGGSNRLMAALGRLAPQVSEYLMRKMVLDKLQSMALPDDPPGSMHS